MKLQGKEKNLQSPKAVVSYCGCTLELSGELLNIHMPKLHPRPIKSESQGMGFVLITENSPLSLLGSKTESH